jgi:hypothetical protein
VSATAAVGFGKSVVSLRDTKSILLGTLRTLANSILMGGHYKAVQSHPTEPKKGVGCLSSFPHVHQHKTTFVAWSGVRSVRVWESEKNYNDLVVMVTCSNLTPCRTEVSMFYRYLCGTSRKWTFTSQSHCTPAS